MNKPISMEFEDIDTDVVKYHLQILHDTNLLKWFEGAKGIPALPKRLTWQGHNLLDELRNKGYGKVESTEKNKPAQQSPFKDIKGL